MPIRKVGSRKPLSAKQKAQRSLAAKASAAKRSAGKAKNSDARGRFSMNSAASRAEATKVPIHDTHEYNEGVKHLRQARRQHLISTGQKPSGKAKSAPKAADTKNKAVTGKGPQSSGPKAFSTKGGSSIRGTSDFTVKDSVYSQNRRKGTATQQAAAHQPGNGKYGAPIKYKGKKSSHYDLKTRKAMR